MTAGDEGKAPRWDRLLWLLLGLGVAVRLVLAFTTAGQRYDLQSFALVNSALHHDPLQVYHQVDDFSTPPYGRWPYPPGFFPAILAIASVSYHLGLTFTSLIRVPAILADVAIAWLVADHLGRRGASPRRRLAAAALVALGPSFIAISAYHGQIDAVAILPAVAAVWLWQRTDAGWRPYAAGALIGAGAAVKVVPLLMLLALIPASRSWREAARLTVTAVALPLAVAAPWLIADGRGKELMYRYRGGPGLGGLSLLTGPRLPLTAFGVGHARIGEVTQALYDHSRWIVGGALAGVGALALRYRPQPADAAVLVWLAVWVFGVTFFLQYIVWGLPFLVMAGRLRAALLVQLALIAPTVVTYASGVTASQVWAFYTVPMIALWAVALAALVVLAVRTARSGPAPGALAAPGRPQPA
jgi:hypothetical protein